MAVKTTDVGDFYHQLALLIKAELPLPESIRQLGANFHKKEFREILGKIGEDTTAVHDLFPSVPYPTDRDRRKIRRAARDFVRGGAFFTDQPAAYEPHARGHGLPDVHHDFRL